MLRAALFVLCALPLLCSTGCAICSSEFDNDYSAFGGAWERHDRRSGRVGSVFAPAGEQVAYGERQTLDEPNEDEAPAEVEGEMAAPVDPNSPDAAEGTPEPENR